MDFFDEFTKRALENQLIKQKDELATYLHRNIYDSLIQFDIQVCTNDGKEVVIKEDAIVKLPENVFETS